MATDHSNEVVAAVDGDAIELTVQSAKFAQPRMYAYALTDTLQPAGILPILRHQPGTPDRYMRVKRRVKAAVALFV